MMSFKEFLISRVKLFFFLLPLTVTAFIVITLFFAPKMKLTYDILIPPLQLSIVGVLLSFVMYFRKQLTFILVIPASSVRYGSKIYQLLISEVLYPVIFFRVISFFSGG